MLSVWRRAARRGDPLQVRTDRHLGGGEPGVHGGEECFGSQDEDAVARLAEWEVTRVGGDERIRLRRQGRLYDWPIISIPQPCEAFERYLTVVDRLQGTRKVVKRLVHTAARLAEPSAQLGSITPLADGPLSD